MQKHNFLNLLMYLEPAACLVALTLMFARKQVRTFRFLAGFLAARLISLAILLPLVHFTGTRVPLRLGYILYFYIYWSSYVVETLIGFGIILSLYRLAMAPLPGLQRLGMLMFRWAGGIALALAISVAVGPHATASSFLVKFVMQLQQTQSILTLCMLLFVCLASKPMGLSHRSKIFGISLGLGVLATWDLVFTAWGFANGKLGSTLNLLQGVVVVAAISIWITYFAVPEPRRRMIVLPTTSPFLRWNQISLALGDEPGFVAIGDVTPEMFAPAEVEVMRRASAKIHASQTSMQMPQLISDAV